MLGKTAKRQAVQPLRSLPSRERIIRAAKELFENRGYHGTGLNEIVRRGKAPKGSIYYHFPGGKDEIAAEAILLVGRSFVENSRVNPVEKQTAADAVRTFVERLSSVIMESGYRSGGSLAIVASETATTNEKLNKACRKAYDLIKGTVRKRLHDRGFPEAEAESLSTAITATVEGGIILSRTYHSRKPLLTIARLLGEMLKAVDPAARRRP